MKAGFNLARCVCLGERRPENYLKWSVRFDEHSYSYSIACDGTRYRTR